MKKIAINGEYERKLERVAPPFLKGKRRTTQRIRWAIDELCRLGMPAASKGDRKAG